MSCQNLAFARFVHAESAFAWSKFLCGMSAFWREYTLSSFVTLEDTCKFYQMGETRIAAADHISFTIEKGEFCII
ncbi:MAG: hypothetical protein RSC73_07490, partial [Ruthenibacterium sp.]